MRLRRRLLLLGFVLIGSCQGDKATAPATVVPAVPVATTVRVTLSGDSTLVVGHGGTAQAVVLDQRGSPYSGAMLTWRSSDTTVATVSAAGAIAALKAGTVTITASTGSVSGSATLRLLLQVVTTLRVTLADTVLAVGTPTVATAVAVDQAGGTVKDVRVGWSSTNRSVATVDTSGRVTTSTIIGSTAIVATSGTITGQTALRTIADPATAAKYRTMAVGWYIDGTAGNGNKSLDSLKRLTVDHAVSVGYNSIQFQYNVAINVDGSLTPPDDEYSQAKMLLLTQYARQRGLKVLWQVFFVYKKGGAAGYVGQGACLRPDELFCDPPTLSHLTLFAAMDQYWSAQASVAETYGVSVLYLGYSMQDISKPEYRAQWTAMVSHVKQRFTGLVSFQQQGTVRYGRPGVAGFPFWDLMDFIGPYYNPWLSDTPIYDIPQVVTAHFDSRMDHSNTIGDLLRTARQYNKPIMLANTHYVLGDGALSGNDDIQWQPTPLIRDNPFPVNVAAGRAANLGLLELVNNNLPPAATLGVAIGGYEPWTWGTWDPNGCAGCWVYVIWWRYELGAHPEIEADITNYLVRPWGYHTTDATTASAGDDIIYVNSGTNTVYPKTGNDEIHGGTGVDTVVLEAASSACTLTTNVTQSPTIPKVVVTCGGKTKQLWDVEYVRYTNTTVALTP